MDDPKVRRSHRIAVALLLVLGTILTPLTIVALFARTQVTDTDRYVQNVEPLASDPALQAYVVDTVTSRLVGAVDLNKYTNDVLGGTRLAPLAGPISTAFEGFVRQTTQKVVTSDQFKTLWIQANRRVHAALLKVLEGKQSDAVITGPKGVVSIDLSVVVQKVIDALSARGITLFKTIPAAVVGRQIQIFKSEGLYKARKGVGLLDKLAFVLPFLIVACFGGAIWLSRNRRRGFVKAAACFALGAIILAVALAVGRNAYLDAAAGSAFPRDAAAAIWDTLLRFLTTSVRAVVFFSLIVAIAAFFTGPSKLAVWYRYGVHRTAYWLGSQSDDAGWTWFGRSAPIARAKRVIQIVIASGAFAVLFFWKHPTPMVILGITLVALVLLAILEFFARDERPPVAPSRAPSTETANAESLAPV